MFWKKTEDLEAMHKQDAQREIRRQKHLEAVHALWRELDAQHAKERLEIEREQNPLLTGTGLTFAKSGPEDIDDLLREATAEQEQMRFPTRAVAPGRDYVLLPQL